MAGARGQDGPSSGANIDDSDEYHVRVSIPPQQRLARRAGASTMSPRRPHVKPESGDVATPSSSHSAGARQSQRAAPSPTTARPVVEHFPRNRNTIQVGNTDIMDIDESPSPPRDILRATARRARRSGTMKGRATAPPASAVASATAAPALTLSPSGQSTRHARASGPLSSSRLGQRRTVGRSSSPHEPVEDSSAILTTAQLTPSPHTVFPSFRGCVRLDGFIKRVDTRQFFDCKFYPYTMPGVDPVFAFVGGSEVCVARPSLSAEASVDVVKWLHEEAVEPLNSPPRPEGDNDEDRSVLGQVNKRGGAAGAASSTRQRAPISLNSCVWMQDPTTKTPLLAVSGKPSAIKVLDILTDKVARTFVGHGREVNDLVVSPSNPSILASASGDHTARIWTLDPAFEKQPCMLICAGDGHRQSLLTLAFHQTGKYLVTGGVDNAVCVWVLPELPNAQSGTDKPTLLHYPHFKTTSIHTNFVDCVAFHHDLIISKGARENKIVIWRIDGFDSRRDPPDKPPSTAEDTATRSAWGGRFQRLTQLDVSDMTAFYMRFSIFSFPGERPILAIGNERSKVFFWDLKSIEEWTRQDFDLTPGAGHQTTETRSRRGYRGGRPRRRGRARMQPQFRDSSVTSDQSNVRMESSHAGALGWDAADNASRSYWAKRLQMEDPYKVLEAHRTSTIHKVLFACRQVAWSVGGEWMVVVGDQGMLGVFHRERPRPAP